MQRGAYDTMAAGKPAEASAETAFVDNPDFLGSIVNAIQGGLNVMDADMTIRMVNDAMRAWYDSAGALEGRKCYEAYHGRDRPCDPCPSLRAMATGNLHIEVVPRRQGGEITGWLELYAKPILDASGRVRGVIEFVRDVTERKKLEAELIAALERAESANQAKSAFLANMSHEIRTPLNAVLGYIQLMLHEELTPRQRERLSVAEESAGALLSIINDILDFSKIEAGKLPLRPAPFCLRKFMDTLVKEQDVLAMAKGLKLSLRIDPGAPPHVRGDVLRLRQVLQNLINNAVKYTVNGMVSVTVRSCRDRGDPEGRVRLTFVVADTGIGIPEAEQATIFESFTQVESGLTKRHAGTGLGLAICKRLAALMDGDVSFESREGQGSAFFFSVPLEEAAEADDAGAEGRPAAPGQGLAPLRILLVEDNRINRMFTVDLLQSRGHEVLVAENGREALDVLALERVELVLMDIQMPIMDGLTATRAIRRGDVPGLDPLLPVIGLSAYALEQERTRFMKAGLNGYIAKPVRLEEFFATVNRVLAEREARGEAVAEPVTRDVLDTAGLYGQYGGKRDLFQRVCGEFFDRAPELLAELHQAVAADDAAAIARLAHTLKGNAAMFGATRLRDAASGIEEAVGREPGAELSRRVDVVGHELDSAVGALHDFLVRLGR